MKNYKDIQNEVAKKHGYENWDHFFENSFSVHDNKPIISMHYMEAVEEINRLVAEQEAIIFAEYTGEYFVKTHGGWWHRFANQIGQPVISTESLLKSEGYNLYKKAIIRNDL